MDYLSPFSCSDHPSCQVLKGCAAGPASVDRVGCRWVFAAGQRDIQDGQATASNVQGCGVGLASLYLAAALIQGVAGGTPGF